MAIETHVLYTVIINPSEKNLMLTFFSLFYWNPITNSFGKFLLSQKDKK